MFRKFVKISEISKCLDISGKCVSIKSGVEEKITVNCKFPILGCHLLDGCLLAPV